MMLAAASRRPRLSECDAAIGNQSRYSSPYPISLTVNDDGLLV